MDRSGKALREVRERIDSIDDRLHDLLMERAALARSVVDAKAESGAPAYRPGREADMLRRLAGRHDNVFPLDALLLIWRQIVAASVGLQERFVVAVYAAEESDACQESAKIHFGAAAPLSVHRTVAGVFNEVTRGNAAVGILPFPAEGEDAPWWPRLVRYVAEEGGERPSIVARLPFVPTQGHSGAARESLAIAMQEPEPSARDRSVVVVMVDTETSRGRVLGAFQSHGLEPKTTLTHRDNAGGGSGLFLIEVDGFLDRGDDRIAAVALEIGGEEPAAVQLLGAYAEPFARRDMDMQPGASRR